MRTYMDGGQYSDKELRSTKTWEKLREDGTLSDALDMRAAKALARHCRRAQKQELQQESDEPIDNQTEHGVIAIGGGEEDNDSDEEEEEDVVDLDGDDLEEDEAEMASHVDESPLKRLAMATVQEEEEGSTAYGRQLLQLVTQEYANRTNLAASEERLRLQMAEAVRMGKHVQAVRNEKEVQTAFELAAMEEAASALAGAQQVLSQQNYEELKCKLGRYMLVRTHPEQDGEIHKWYARLCQTRERHRTAAAALVEARKAAAGARAVLEQGQRRRTAVDAELLSVQSVVRGQREEQLRLGRVLAELEGRQPDAYRSMALFHSMPGPMPVKRRLN